MELLTNRQKEVLQFIKKAIVKKGYPPTIREIGKAMGLSSPATIHTHLANLEAKGYLRRNETKNRAIELLVENEFINKDNDVVLVPLLGTVTAGSPIEAIENPSEFFSLPVNLIPLKAEIFTLLVEGDSMINVGIYDGDVVIVQKQKVANNGEIVVAMTDENTVTLKTFYKEKDYFRLQPENNTFEPLILKEVTILGKAIGLYRKL
ncbi:MAG: transcriptional repressor LexA [Bacilli bacterium]|jgi:repressor LexA|nr:transcriptional repressor LexA [Bacilli bacterium]